MKKVLLLFIIVPFLSLGGCASARTGQAKAVVQNVPAVQQSVSPENAGPLLEGVAAENLEQEQPVPRGVVFAKADFGGVLKSSYVKLTIVNQANPQEQYKLYIGNRKKQPLGWDAKTIDPMYFFIDLPAGDFRIASLSIPVGTSLATEAMDIRFSVDADEVAYLGTLSVFVSKEKIRLGGVPVIKPGFEYEAGVLDQSDEGKKAFSAKYPDVEKDVHTRLMVIHPLPKSE